MPKQLRRRINEEFKAPDYCIKTGYDADMIPREFSIKGLFETERFLSKNCIEQIAKETLNGSKRTIDLVDAPILPGTTLGDIVVKFQKATISIGQRDKIFHLEECSPRITVYAPTDLSEKEVETYIKFMKECFETMKSD